MIAFQAKDQSSSLCRRTIRKGKNMLLIIGVSILLATITAFLGLIVLGFWLQAVSEHIWFLLPALIMTGFFFIILYFDNMFITQVILQQGR